MAQERNLQINISWLLSIVLVMYIHAYNIGLSTGGHHITAISFPISYWIENLMSDGICRTAVPLFFMISGWLFFKHYEGLKSTFFVNQWEKRVHSLLLPFLIWSAIGIGIYALLQALPISSGFFNSTPIRELTMKQLLHLWLVLPVNFQLWFLQVLVVLVLLSPLIGWLSQKQPVFFLLIFMVIWFWRGGYMGLSSYFFEGLFFFSTGAVAAIQKWKVPRMNVWWNLSVWFSLIAFKHYLFSHDAFTWGIAVGKLSIIPGMLTIWHLSGWLRHPWLTKLSTITFWIYLVHEPLNTMVKKGLLMPGSPFSQLPLVVYFISPIIVLCLIVPMGFALRTKLTGIYNLLTGSRG